MRATGCISWPQTVASTCKRVPARAPVGETAHGAPAWSGGRVRLIAAALKAAGRASVPGVRIPPAPLCDVSGLTPVNSVAWLCVTLVCVAPSGLLAGWGLGEGGGASDGTAWAARHGLDRWETEG